MILLVLFSYSCSLSKDERLSSFQPNKTELDSLIDASIILIQSENFDSAKLLLDQTEEISIQFADSVSLSNTYNNQGLLYYYLGDYKLSIDLYKQALDINKQRLDSMRIIINLKNLGISNSRVGKYQTALLYYLEALDIADKKNDLSQEASINNSIGNTLNDLERFERSYEYFKAAEQIWSELGDSLRLTYALGNLGTSLLGQRRTEEAIESHLKALELKKVVANEGSIAITLNNLGESYMQLNDLEIAYDYLTSALEIREKIGETKQVAITCNNLGSIEIDQGNPIRANEWLSRAENIARIESLPDILIENLRLQKKLYSKQGDYKKAFETALEFDVMKDSAFNDQVVKVQELELEQEESLKEAYKSQLELSESKREIQQARSDIQLLIIMVTILAVVIISYFAYSLRKKNRHIENLIRELHHRVKNHLGMISGLFGAQTGLSMADSAVLDEAKMRVEAVQGIHRRLFLDEYEFVNMQEYLEELVDNNALVFGLFNRIDKQMVIREQVMEIDKAISVGLIANEVLTNAFKYGLQETKKPVLRIVLERAVKGYKMIIFNNASTDKSSGGGKAVGGGFGGELISRLAQNLKGRIQIIKEGGFQFELTFP